LKADGGVRAMVDALVKKPRLIKMRGIETGLRRGRGFSKLELAEVDLTIAEARKLGLPVDPRRRSKHEWNVKILQEYMENLKKS